MKYSKIFFTISFFLLATSQSSADDFMDYYTAIFDENLLKGREYALHFYNNPYSTDSLSSPGNTQNILEWQKQYPEIKNIEFFSQLIYETTLKEFQKLVEGLTTGINPFPENEFAKLLLLKKDKETLLYLLYAKRCEPLVLETIDDEDADGFSKLKKEGEALMKATKNPFIKQRFAFQLVRLVECNDSPKEAIALFDEIATKWEKNYIYYRTYTHKAFALKKMKKYTEGNLILAEIFLREASLRGVAYFHLCQYPDRENSTWVSGTTDEMWNATLGSANNSQIKNILYLVYNSSQYDTRDIYLKGALENGANVGQLEVMFLKQLKIVEKEYYLPHLTQEAALDSANLTYGYDAPPPLPPAPPKPEEPKGFFTQLLEAFFNWLERLIMGKRKDTYDNYYKQDLNIKDLREHQDLISLEKIATKIAEVHQDSAAIFYLGISYLQAMRGEYDSTKINLARAKKTLGKNKILLEQALYVETLIAVLASEKIDEKLENLLFKNTKQLWKSETGNNEWQKTLLFAELGRKYLTQNEFPKAVLSFYHCEENTAAGVLLDCYGNQEDLIKYANFIKGEANTPIKKLFWHLLPKTELEKKNLINDIRATRLAREGEFGGALKVFKEISKDYWLTNDSIPQNIESDTLTAEQKLLKEAIEEMIRQFSISRQQEECKKIQTSFEDPITEVDSFMVFSNKMEFLKHLVQLELSIKGKQGNEAANIYIKMGNGMFHTFFWLYNNTIWQCDGMIGAMQKTLPTQYPFNINSEVATRLHNQRKNLALHYKQPFLSYKYYKKAFEVATSRDIKADALLYQALSWDKQLSSFDEHLRPDYTPNLLLEKEYADTPQAKKLADNKPQKQENQ